MKNKVHLVLDLETLSTKKNAVVLSVGYAIVKGCEIVQFGEYRLDPEQQPGGHVDFGTLQWWMDGTKAKAQEHLASQPVRSVHDMFDMLTANVSTHSSWDKILVWGNSPNFDCDILSDLLSEPFGPGRPWKYWNERDMRTLRDISGLRRNDPIIPHVAMYDACAEAQDLCDFLKTLPDK